MPRVAVCLRLARSRVFEISAWINSQINTRIDARINVWIDASGASLKQESPLTETKLSLLVLRSALGGTLMGLANLVPGISGGTMLLAAGIYPRFIGAVAELSTLRLRRRSIAILLAVAGAALLSILLLAGTIKNLVVEHRWVMYSLFIGLTLGGLPVVWRLARPIRPAVWWGALGGFAAMATLGVAQAGEAGGALSSSGFVMLLLAGLAGASAMILPGISGGYLLLVLGQYVPILSAIDRFKEAVGARDAAAALQPALGVLLPVAIGVLAGILAVSNLLRWLLDRFEKATLGVLVGLLLGAVVGLWPFQQSVTPIPGETWIQGEVVTTEHLAEIAPEDYPTERFRPTAAQVAGAVSLIVVGFLITTGVARIGSDEL